MCIFHWINYGCGYEDLRTDVEQSLCATFVKLSGIAPTFLCLDKKRTYLNEPRRCNRCRVCDLENAYLASCVTNERGRQPHSVNICRRHPTMVGRRTFTGDTSVPSDPENCELCGQQVKNREEDDRLRHIARAVYRRGAKGDSKSWESSCRFIAQESQEVPKDPVKLPPAMKQAQQPKSCMPPPNTNPRLNIASGPTDQTCIRKEPGFWDRSGQLIAQGLEEARSGRRVLSFKARQVQYPTMLQDQRWIFLQKAPPKDFVLDIASSKLLLRRKKDRQRRYVAEAIDGKMGAILRSRGLYNRKVDAWLRMELERQDIPDKKLKIVIDSFLRRIRAIQPSVYANVTAARAVDRGNIS